MSLSPEVCMKRRNVNRVHQTNNAVRNSVQWRLLFLTMICAAIVAAGFFYAARQHFATMEFGLKNSKLRKQVEDLEAERRRLILAKEVSLSPVEMKRLAQDIGLRELAATPPTAAAIKEVKAVEPQTPAPTLASFPVERASENKVVKPALASYAADKRSDKKAAKPAETKTLVKPIVQQSAVKIASPDVRPRIALTDKRVADATPTSTSKLR